MKATTSVVIVGFGLVVSLSGCSGSSTSPSPSAARTAPSSAAGRSAPIGLVAIGHSGLTAENSDAAAPGQPAPQNSWATGTSRRVDSVYRRMVAAIPATKGKVVNNATGGASVATLAGQAEAALLTVPTPALVIVQTIDSDIQCDGSDVANVPRFGLALRDALRSITAASPDSKLLVVGQLGRPRPAFVKRVVAAHPEVKGDLSGSGICDFYDEHGRLVPAHFGTLTRIIGKYEAEQARVCAEIPNCQTDGGVRATYKDKLANFTDDWNHLNVRGQADEAALIWPVVAKILNVR
jgi:hypothetical protein